MERSVRLFVSSTFRDMQAERDELVLRVFPQLRKRCERRGVTWGEVDLRWGITEEQTAEGRVLPICLAEIERCRPYFIGLLGERYGWVPEEIEPGLIEQQPWLAEHTERSVTELEIVHGVLRNPAMADHAFFYLRDPAYVDSLSERERVEFLERPSEEEVERLGSEEAERRAQERRGKLVALKERIRASDFPVEGDYADPRALGELVLRDLGGVIDELYPEGSEPEPLEREAAEHEAFARGRAAVYVGRPRYFERLERHAAGADPPLVVLGESGMGKSALLANWALRYRHSHPEALVVMHFIGSSPYSTDWAAMLRRVLGELGRRFDIEEEIPDQPEELRQAFANRLHMAAARGRVVLILDALNQLDDREGAPDLVWLPPELPVNVRLVLSALPGRPLEELQKRGWSTLRVEPLETGERKQLITAYLRQYARALGPAQLERIASAPQSANPLYLRALLEELRVWGKHETLGDRIDHYLGAEAIDDLYELILERYEQDYDGDRLGLVRDAMTLIWAARRGLSEAELLDLLGSDGEPLPPALWSPLHLAAEQSLARRSGLLGFSHDYLRRAVEERYLSRTEDREAAHLRLADYFDARREEPRGLDELPWQLAESGSWQRLYELLAEPGFFGHAWKASHFDVKTYWARLEANSSLRLVDAYRPLLDAPGAHGGQRLTTVSALLDDTGHPAEALSLREHLVEHYRQTGDRANLQASLGNHALILRARGELDEALALLSEQERICRELGDRDGLRASLGNQAPVLWAWGDFDEALELHKEEERICRELGDRAGLSTSLGNRAVVLKDKGEFDEALALYKEQERICRELGDRAELSGSLTGQGIVLRARGQLDEALALHKEVERISRELGNRAGLQASLGNQALILRTRGELDEALALHKEEERICRELGDRAGLSRSLGNQAMVLRARGELDEALALLSEQERICRELGDRAGLSRSLGNRAVVLEDKGELDEALALHKEEERICRELGDRDGLRASLGNQALMLQDKGELDEALALHKEVLRICRELGDRDGLRASLGNQALMLQDKGELDEALALHKEEERICRELGDQAGLAGSLGNQALILEKRGELEEAMALHKEEERVCRELGDRDGLSRSLGNQAPIRWAWGELDGAMALYKEKERICHELGDRAGLAGSLGGQALIRGARGELDGALALHKEEERICRELGDRGGLSRSLGNQAAMLWARGELDGAMALRSEQERVCRELGDRAGIAGSLGGQALIRGARAELDEAMALHKEEERICRELGDPNGLATSLTNQALLLAAMGRRDEALLVVREAYRIASKHRLTSLARQIQSALQAVR